MRYIYTWMIYNSNKKLTTKTIKYIFLLSGFIECANRKNLEEIIPPKSLYMYIYI